MPITWHSVDLKTGKRGQRLYVRELGTVSRVIGEVSTTSIDVRCYDPMLEPNPTRVPTSAGIVPGWETATLPGRMMIVACDDLDLPLWGGMVTNRENDLASPWVQVDAATLEAYFDRRFVTDHDYTETAQGVIVSGILTADVIPTGVQFIVDSSSATPRDVETSADSDKTALSVIQELMALDGGPEVTVDLEWADSDHTILNRVVRVRDRIGTPSANPAAVFKMPGAVVGGSFGEDFTSENGANDVLAVSTASVGGRPTSTPGGHVAQDLLDNGWVRYELRYSPGESIDDEDVLNSHATAELAEVRDGVNTLALTVSMDAGGPRYGIDFFLGDDIGVELTTFRFPRRVGPDGDLRPGFEAVTRCEGITLDLDARTLTPKIPVLG